MATTKCPKCNKTTSNRNMYKCKDCKATFCMSCRIQGCPSCRSGNVTYMFPR